MSLTNAVAANCPFCNSEQSFEIYASVNITVDPSLKEKVMNGTINDNTCSGCGKTVNVVTALLYHDMIGKFIISLNMAEEESLQPQFDNPFSEQEGYIVREVRSYPELVEKIMIFDNKLNDIVVAKIAEMYQTSFREMLGHELHVFFSNIENGLFRKKIVFNCFSNPEQMMRLRQPLSKIEKPLRDALYDMDTLRIRTV